jgi:hypothetical protein
MAAPESNYVLTVTMNCGTCHTETPLHFDAGVPFNQVRFPYRATMPYVCSGCGAKDDVSINLAQAPATPEYN